MGSNDSDFIESDIDKILRYGKQHKAINDMLHLLGKYQIDLEIQVDNRECLQEIIIDLRNKFPIINKNFIYPISIQIHESYI